MSSILEPPPPTEWNIISLGAGVQSSCMALMAAKGEITPMPDFAVFADTQAEPQSVYDWLDWLEKELPFPVYRVTKGNLKEATLDLNVATGRGSRKKGTTYYKQVIPLFGLKKNGEKTAGLGRQCTSDYKIKVIIKAIRDRCNIKRGQKEITVTQWIGISWDEIQRAKYPRDPWTQHRWPLIERKMQRHECLQWMEDNGYPKPPRSACVYCPFHSDTEWRRLRDYEPPEFQKAIQFDRTIRQRYRDNDEYTQMEVYLHRSCRPLDEVDFDGDEDKGQQVWDFTAECEGMCGV